MTPPRLTTERWAELESWSQEFTCYSAALATWVALEDERWGRLVNTRLWLALTEEPQGLFGFAYFRPDLRAQLGLVRAGTDDPDEAIAAVRGELAAGGRVIIAGDGFALPWHVAHGRVHAPHWFVLTGTPDRIEVADPFACRNELGLQGTTRAPIQAESLPTLLAALPGDDAVHRLREVLALGDETREATERRYQWLARAEVRDWRDPHGLQGPAAIIRLAEHFRAHGEEPEAYVQADDIWSIARHRAFTCRYTQLEVERVRDGRLAGWVAEHAAPLAKRWGHIAPLLMQASLTLRAGRRPSSSVPDTLEQLAELERAAALAIEENCSSI